jgi:hypothetical protein
VPAHRLRMRSGDGCAAAQQPQERSDDGWAVTMSVSRSWPPVPLRGDVGSGVIAVAGVLEIQLALDPVPVRLTG